MRYVVLYLIIAVLVLFGAKINVDKEKCVTNIQKQVDSLRGVMAILIIFTHCTLAYTNLPIALLPLRKISTFAVGYFFVLSGYGLAYSFNRKKDYLKGFIVSKIIKKILLSAFVCMIVSHTLMMIFVDKEFSWMSIRGALQSVNWYIYALTFLYLVFVAIYSNVDDSSLRVWLIWTSVIWATIIVLLLSIMGVQVGRSYYISEWAFPFGITLYEKRDFFERIIKKSVLFIFVMIVTLGITFVWAAKAKEGTLSDLVSHNVMIFPFYLLIFDICKYFVFKNKVLLFLNGISFEIYLYQFPFLAIMRHYYNSLDEIYFIITMLVTIAWATLMHFLMNKSIANKVK